MLICRLKDCTCIHHHLLNCIKKGLNDDAKSILQKLDNFCNLADRFGWTFLHYSAVYGNTVMVQDLIDGGCEINAQNVTGVTSLMLATKYKHLTTTEALLKNGADMFVTNSNGVNSLHLAADNRLSPSTFLPLNQDSYLIMDMFFDKINENLLTDKPKTTHLLSNASDLVKLAIVVLADVDLASFMLKNGYDIGYRDGGGRCALACAIYYVKIENAKLLISHGANFNGNEQSENMPIAYYRPNCESLDANSETLKYLLKCAIGDVCPADRTKRKDVECLLMLGNKRTVRTVQ